MRRLLCLLLLAVAALAGCNREPLAVLDSEAWQAYRTAFVTAEGRVIDTGNGGISHSEGQGYGMLLAVAAGDQPSFERLWQWTREHLQVREDHLFAWKWVPDSSVAVPDRNDASDGDLLIAWALSRAGRRWGVAEYTNAARAIAHDIRERLIVPSGFGPVLLPGQIGFRAGSTVTLNPSYWVFPALREMRRLEGLPIWSELQASGWELMRQGAFGKHRLPPDWLSVSGERVALSESLSRRFGFDALRVPLYSCWAGKRDLPVLEQIYEFWNRADAPAWADLQTDETASYGLTWGQQRVRDLLARCLGRNSATAGATLPEGVDYYSATLALLAQLARVEGMIE